MCAIYSETAIVMKQVETIEMKQVETQVLLPTVCSQRCLVSQKITHQSPISRTRTVFWPNPLAAPVS